MENSYLCRSTEDVCLILTQSWQPFGITTAKEGFRKLMRGSFRKKANIKAIDRDGNLYNFNDWVTRANYFDNQPYISSIQRDYPIPTVLIANSLYFYRPRINKVSIKHLYKHFNGKCQICNKVKKIEYMSKEHIIPKSKGGDNSPENLTLTCRTCNCKKADIFPYLTSSGKKLESMSSYKPSLKINREEWKFFIRE